MMPLRIVFCACLALSVSGMVCAERPTLKVPSTSEVLTIDGDLSEADWKSAATITELTPALNNKYFDYIAKVPTTVRVLWHEDFMYVAYECTDKDPQADPELKRDDNIYFHDVIEVFIDPVGDQRQYWEIQVSPLNQILDLIFVCNAEPKHQADGVLDKVFMKKHLFGIREYSVPDLQTAVKKTESGWTVEMAIPAKVLMKPHGKKQFEPMTLRANFLRYDRQLNKKGKPWIVHMNWSPVRHGCPHISPAAMGHVELLPPR